MKRMSDASVQNVSLKIAGQSFLFVIFRRKCVLQTIQFKIVEMSG